MESLRYYETQEFINTVLDKFLNIVDGEKFADLYSFSATNDYCAIRDKNNGFLLFQINKGTLGFSIISDGVGPELWIKDAYSAAYRKVSRLHGKVQNMYKKHQEYKEKQRIEAQQTEADNAKSKTLNWLSQIEQKCK